jgi:hypothetical protein
MAANFMIWRRLDLPGHDACRLDRAGDGWRLRGRAVFRHGEGPAALDYRLTCDNGWRACEGVVQGWIGSREIDLHVVRTPDGGWMLNDKARPALRGLQDLDFGFTPATNLSQLRRIGLAIGEHASVPVAWLDVPAGTIDVLDQRYERRDGNSYWYEAPRFGYAALLAVGTGGFVATYPDLWESQL